MKCFGPKNIKKAGGFPSQRFKMFRTENGGRFELKKTALNPLYDENYHILILSFFRQYLMKILIFFHFHKCSNIMKKMRCFKSISDNFKWVK